MFFEKCGKALRCWYGRTRTIFCTAQGTDSTGIRQQVFPTLSVCQPGCKSTVEGVTGAGGIHRINGKCRLAAAAILVLPDESRFAKGNYNRRTILAQF